MSRSHRLSVGLVAAAVLLSGCYGPFNLTRRLYNWNGTINGKWEKEFVFILLAWAPVYGLTVLGDAVIFNSMEFWTGRNPVDPPARSALPKTKRLARGRDAALLTYTPGADGAQLLVEQFRQGVSAGSLRLESRHGETVGLAADGATLFTARTLPDGSVLVHDGAGTVVASYTAQQAQQLLADATRW